MNTQRCPLCTKDLPKSAYAPSQFGIKGRRCRACATLRQREKRHETKSRGAKPRRYGDSCHWCGKDIRHTRADNKWCSSSCAMKGWRKANPGRQREHWLKCEYSITPDEFDALLASQGGRCAICRTDSPPGEGRIGQWNVDHDHKTGEVRGILCSQCNIGIGSLRDEPDLLRAAIAYLEKHLAKPQE